MSAALRAKSFVSRTVATIAITLSSSILLSCNDRMTAATTIPLIATKKSNVHPPSENSGATLDQATPSGRLLMRRSNVIRNSIAKALVVDPRGMCMELGRLPCADIVHRVGLGGLDAYTNTQYFHPADISVTAPAALERIAMSACIQRAQMDLVAPAQAVIYKNIDLSIDGRLIDSPAVNDAINSLYKRLFSRVATPVETDALRQLYRDIYESEPIGAARNWMVLACFAVTSSAESFFY